MKVAVVRYNAGNVQSLSFALERLGVTPVITDDPELLKTSDKIIFPGQGEASSAMDYLKDRKLDIAIRELKQPFLGVCLGMQLMCEFSEENETECLGIIPATVKRFEDTRKVPHMGWNSVFSLEGPLFENVNENDYLYFVHSYYVEHCNQTTATSEYGIKFSAAIQEDNFHAIQPHPEKSAESGMQILKNFLEM